MNADETKKGRFQPPARLRLFSMSCLVAAAVATCLHPRALAQAPAPAPKASSAPAGNAENGKKLYLAKGCWECHDYEGQGGAGPRIGPPRLSVTAVIAYLRQPKGQMPPYVSKVLSDSDVTDIYAFLQSVPKAAPLKNIPLLDY